jgi:hypothetical protein
MSYFSARHPASSLSDADVEARAQFALAQARDAHGPAVKILYDPPPSKHHLEQSCSQGPCKVGLPLAPVEAGVRPSRHL